MYLTTPLLATLSLLTLATAHPSPKGQYRKQAVGLYSWEHSDGAMHQLVATADDWDSSTCWRSDDPITWVKLSDGARCKFTTNRECAGSGRMMNGPLESHSLEGKGFYAYTCGYDGWNN